MSAVRIQQTIESLARTTFYGVPAENFIFAGREQFIYLLQAGLTPDSKVLDIGCGVLRAGYWLIHFLNPGCYCGIEPHQKRLETGIQKILEPVVLSCKKPRFDTNPDFNTAVFGEKFDFFLAYSIWTHASKQQIGIMLDGFVRDSSADAGFLLTFLPSGWRHRDYRGPHWFGTSHESETPGTIAHSFSWIRSQCVERRLIVRKLTRDKAHRHRWLEIRKEAGRQRG